jgi:hypothetical protein
MEKRKLTPRWFVIRLFALTVLAVAYWATPARAFTPCQACVWQWNGSGYVADCQGTTGSGYLGCIPGDGFCWVGDSCGI